MKKPSHLPTGYVTGPDRRRLMEAGLDYAGTLNDPAGVFMLKTGKPWFNGKLYWIPVQLALPSDLAKEALNQP